MNRTMTAPVLLALLSMLAPSAALAQAGASPGAQAGDMAVSGNLGFANAFDDDFDDFEPLLTGSFEFYTSDRISWRGLVGFTEFDARIRRRNNEADVAFVNGNVVYHWQMDRVSPFATGGVGIYDKDSSGPFFPSRGSDLEIGLNFGGGIAIGLDDHWAIKLEGIFHGVTGDEPDSFFAGTAGAMYRF
ncbi:MAG: outer membrane protein [Planctomycetota bacterium]